MQNIEVTCSYAETRDRLFDMFLTNEFKNCYWVQDVARRAASRVDALGFYEASHPVEHGHFTTWMGFICKRKYDNPYIHDLYLLHELAHFSEFLWAPNKPFSIWFGNMFNNEFNAALMSEVYVYFYMRENGYEIRSKTFPHRIWADRWLEQGLPLCELEDEIVADRRMKINGYGVRQNAEFGTDDYCDFQISRYADQNYQWADIWRKHYDIVETSMFEVCKWKKSFVDHYETLVSFEDDSVFFLDEAIRFDKIYRENNQRFGDFPGSERSVNVCEASAEGHQKVCQ